MTTMTAPVLTGTWRADTAHSSLGFAVRHMAVSMFRGEVTDFDVVLDAAGDAPALSGTGRVASIVTRDEQLTAHLAAPDFFDAERHPEMRLRSRAVRVDGAAVRIDADLTIKGISRPVVLTGSLSGPVDDPFGATRIGLALVTTIDRRDFGLDFTLPLPRGGLALGWDVRLSAELELVREG